MFHINNTDFCLNSRQCMYQKSLKRTCPASDSVTPLRFVVFSTIKLKGEVKLFIREFLEVLLS